MAIPAQSPRGMGGREGGVRVKNSNIEYSPLSVGLPRCPAYPPSCLTSQLRYVARSEDLQLDQSALLFGKDSRSITPSNGGANNLLSFGGALKWG